MSEDKKVEDVINILDGKKRTWRMKVSYWEDESLIEAFTEEEAIKKAEKMCDEANRSNRSYFYFCDEVACVEE